MSAGGGSALLPAPIPPISLQEKLGVTRKLAAAGATIQELNTVRRALSFLKGGGLAHSAHPAKVTLLHPHEGILSERRCTNTRSFELRRHVLLHFFSPS